MAKVPARRKSRRLALGAATVVMGTAIAATSGVPAAQAVLPAKTYEIAFQDDTGALAVAGRNNIATEVPVKLATDSRPSITADSGPSYGFGVAYRRDDSLLGLYDNNIGVPIAVNDQPLAGGTSPSVAALVTTSPGMFHQLWWNQSNPDSLFAQSGIRSLEARVMSSPRPGSSPAVARNVSGSLVKVAVVGSDGFLRQSTNRSAFSSEGVNVFVSPNTSPAVAAGPSDAMIAVNGNGDLLLNRSSDRTANDTGLSMQPGSSPSIAALSTGGFETAFVGPDNMLWVADANGNGHSTGQAIASHSNPAIAADDSGGWKVAYIDSTGTISTYKSTGEVVRLQNAHAKNVGLWSGPAIAYVTPAADPGPITPDAQR
ncbi:hypothetical protein [Streptomyces sp. NPDC002516]